MHCFFLFLVAKMLCLSTVYRLCSNFQHRIIPFSYHAIHTTVHFSKNDGDEKPTSKYIQLLDEMKDNNKDENPSLSTLTKKLRTQNKRDKMRNTTAHLKNQKEINKKGEEFWFPEPVNEFDEKVLSEITQDAEMLASDTSVAFIATDESQSSSAVEEIIIACETKPLQIDKLKEKIKDQDDSRSVSKLMNALIDDIDQDEDTAEESFKKLLSAFSKADTEKQEPLNKQSTRRKTQQRKRLSGTYFHEPTRLFEEYIENDMDAQKGDFNSLFREHWEKELQNMLPEAIPENMFEVKMLNVDREWKFPIDNEQDLGLEEDIGFEEHVFLDHHLDEFPTEGPVRKFMELVITGLQQNPYLSVEEKTNRIFWFRDYLKKFPDEDLEINLE